MTRRTEPPTLPGCEVLPPMDSGESPQQYGSQRPSKAPQTKGKPSRKTAGRFAELNTFVDFSLAGLGRSEIAVWLVLFRDTKRDGIARTGQEDIARRASISERTVRRAIRRLEKRGLLVVVRRGGLSSGPSAYRVRPLADHGA